MARLLFERKIVKEARHSVYEMTSFTAILRRLYAVTFQFTTVVTNAVVSSFFFLPPFPVPPPPPPCQFKHFLFPRTTGYTIYVLILVSGILPSARLYSNSKRIVSLFSFSFLFSYLHLIIVLNLFAIHRQRCCKKRGPF